MFSKKDIIDVLQKITESNLVKDECILQGKELNFLENTTIYEPNTNKNILNILISYPKECEKQYYIIFEANINGRANIPDEIAKEIKEYFSETGINVLASAICYDSVYEFDNIIITVTF